jgi:hypothetical protein
MELMMYKTKPTDPEEGKQLFSEDVIKDNGAKRFMFMTYEEIYDRIKSRKYSYYYEDTTFNNLIKLHVDFDLKMEIKTELERDKLCEKVSNEIIRNVNEKLKENGIENPETIILLSDTMMKLSIHIIYPKVVFRNMKSMKIFMEEIQTIDHAIYRIGAFRMMYCSKKGKKNVLMYYGSKNYNAENKEEYELFIDSCICNITVENVKIIEIPEMEKKIKESVEKTYTLKTNTDERDYIYSDVDWDKLKQFLHTLKKYSNDYENWLKIVFCLKDLYLSVYESQKEKVYELFEYFSKFSKKYNAEGNREIFFNVIPKININYLMYLAESEYRIYPIIKLDRKLFNPKNHKNIITMNKQYIEIDVNKALGYKYIFIKSPCGTGKTVNLLKLIKSLNDENIISITSRRNLAGEHMKVLNLKFYSDLLYEQYKNCNKLVIQLESLTKCNYKLFKNGVVILDEINSILTHLRSPTMNNRRKEIYDYLVEIVKNAKCVICLDADLADWNCEFLQDIQENEYIIYYNSVKNKSGTVVKIYESVQIMVDIMEEKIKKKQYFMACFDSLKEMNNIINYLKKHLNPESYLVYSSEIEYDIIDTEDWIDKYVFFTPSIIYGIDFNYAKVDVYSFTKKMHLNSQNIYQMLSRARQQNEVFVYCNKSKRYNKYESVEDVKEETLYYEKHLKKLVPTLKNDMEVDDTAYRTMYYNQKYIDGLLKSNIKEHLIEILYDKGYSIEYDKTEKKNCYDGVGEIPPSKIKENIVKLLKLDSKNLTDFEKKLVSDDKALEKHFNLRLILKNKLDDCILKSVNENLLIETFKNKYVKIKLCMELMQILEIEKFENLTKDLTDNFQSDLEGENLNKLKKIINSIKFTFNIRTKKYDDFSYYNIYLLCVTLLRQLFDVNMFKRKIIRIENKKYAYYDFKEEIYKNHIKIIEINNKNNLIYDISEED